MQVLKDILEEKAEYYNKPGFIEQDPVGIPHQYIEKQDIEISGFLTALIAWGQRKTILRNAARLMKLMDNSPADFILHHQENDLKGIEHFVHRTFNGVDTIYFLKSLQRLYHKRGGIGDVIEKFYIETGSLKEAITRFRELFFDFYPPGRTAKHLPRVENGASAKRLNMYLRWMVRKDNKGVDFGIWKKIPPSALYIPLDIHSGRIARDLKLLKRKQNDWKAVEELTGKLRKYDPADPVKYDFALFGMGINEKMI